MRPHDCARTWRVARLSSRPARRFCSSGRSCAPTSWSPDPHAQSKALAAILDSRTRGAPRLRDGRACGAPPTPRGMRRGCGKVSAKRSAACRLRPAHVAALALLLIGTALGLRWLEGSNTSNGTQQPEAPAVANTNSLPPQAEAAAEDGEKRSLDSDPVESRTVQQEKPQTPTHLAGTNPNPRAGREGAQVRRDGHRAVNERRRDLAAS